MIELQNLTKSFGKKTVIEGLSYVFEDNKVYLLRGKSGCGKSTLLRILSGLDRDYSGTISYNPSAAEKISMSFQDIRLFPWLDAASNAAIGLWGEDLSDAGKADAAEKMLLRLGFTGSETRLFPRSLSGGMQARIGLARALLRNADVYLLDEPFANLDPDTAALCLSVVSDETSRRGSCAIAVSHAGATLPGCVVLECAGTPFSSLEPIGET